MHTGAHLTNGVGARGGGLPLDADRRPVRGVARLESARRGPRRIRRGDKVSHGGGKWVSTVASNVWEPGVYGWEAYTGEDEEAVPAALADEPEAVDLEAMTIPQLKEYAQERGINLAGKPLKADIIAAIRAAL